VSKDKKKSAKVAMPKAVAKAKTNGAKKRKAG
jgi:hypothetical protein